MKYIRLGIILVLVAIVCMLMANNGSWIQPADSDSVTSNTTILKDSLDVKNYVISTGLPHIRLMQQEGLLSEGDEGYDWDCDDYARALTKQAMIDGVDIGMALTVQHYADGRMKVHLTNFAILGSRIVEVSPQIGRVTETWFGYKMKVD
uniref:Uncharacterized protein n=1 Tax=viral metagenome TaxID=1070528 RepID=A0A6M3L6J0_9ZZZZ